MCPVSPPSQHSTDIVNVRTRWAFPGQNCCGNSLSGASARGRVTSIAPRVAHSRSVDMCFCVCFFGTPPRVPPAKPSVPASQAIPLTFPCVVDFGAGDSNVDVLRLLESWSSRGEKWRAGEKKMSPFGDP